MEQHANVDPTPGPNLFDLQLDNTSLDYLREASKWARFLAIIGFVFCGLMVIGALFAGTIMATMMSTAMGGYSVIGGGVFTVVYLFFAALWFFPCLFLYRFASHMQLAIRNNEQEKLLGSLKNLKSYFRFIGILFIVILSLYALMFVGAIIAGIAGGMA